MKINIKEETKLASEKQNFKKYCKYCGHTMSFYAFEKDRKLCNWCGRFNYRDEKSEFKDKLLSQLKKSK